MKEKKPSPDITRDTHVGLDAYEPPRILRKRSVERTTLFQTGIAPPPGGGGGGPPIGGH
jgi:hypothetical protein